MIGLEDISADWKSTEPATDTRTGKTILDEKTGKPVQRDIILVEPIVQRIVDTVIAREKDGTIKRFIVDIDLIGKEGRSDLDVPLKPGDVIWVPESWY